MIIGIPRETFAGENRVALVPDAVSGLVALNSEIIVEPGAGTAAGFADTDYTECGAQIAADRDEVFARADVVLQVRTFGANPEAGRADLALARSGQIIIGASDPLTAGPQLRELATTGATLFAMELIPRITRAQSMDILSSMATIAGYKAVLMAADALPRMFPLLMTAAGTLTPARVLIIGAGVA
ncbi:MAG: NAD(P)(+) transhydrogenase (Re/Si-specific) subunit alpha, partial [Gemmatimonadetes bacterium]|nr:NAD(P)(+) transhydrogenase (Re/Si-specific) subunit alpha [Gemmatimonadota bacterium]